MDDARRTMNDPMGRLDAKIDRLEGKIDALTGAVENMGNRLEGVETRLTSVETGLTSVETRLTTVETRLTRVDDTLTKVHVLAGETDRFARNVWDALGSLERRMIEGFDEAKRENKKEFAVVHAAIRAWGRRVDAFEKTPVRATKRRR